MIPKTTPYGAITRGFCYLCGHYDEAQSPSSKVGDRSPLAGHRFTEKWLKESGTPPPSESEGTSDPVDRRPRASASLAANHGAEDRWVDIARSRPRLNGANDRLNITTKRSSRPRYSARREDPRSRCLPTNGRVGPFASRPKIRAASTSPERRRRSQVGRGPAPGFTQYSRKLWR